MKILFNEMNDTVLEHFQGGEGRFVPKMFNDGTNKIMRGRLEPGCTVGMHTHVGTSEILFALSGEGKMYLPDGTVETLLPGDCHYCPEGTGHNLHNEGTEDFIFWAVVPTHNKA